MSILYYMYISFWVVMTHIYKCLDRYIMYIPLTWIVISTSYAKSSPLSLIEGVVEIWLTSEDTGAYGKDIGVTLPQLLWKLVDVIPEGCMLRLGMTNPPYILEHLEVSSQS